jgi:hypothetical protein
MNHWATFAAIIRAPRNTDSGPKTVVAEHNRATTILTTQGAQERPKTAPRNNPQARRVLPVDPESLPPASGSRRSTSPAIGCAHRAPRQCREPTENWARQSPTPKTRHASKFRQAPRRCPGARYCS